MKNLMKRIMMVVSFLMFMNFSLAHAQTATSQFPNFRKNTATVMFAGLGGAVLGLSTLSFYGEPSEHTGNIWAGLAVGILGGLVYVSLSNDQDEFAGLTVDAQGAPTAVYRIEF